MASHQGRRFMLKRIGEDHGDTLACWGGGGLRQGDDEVDAETRSRSSKAYDVGLLPLRARIG